MNDLSVNNDESHFAGAEQKLRKKNAGRGAPSDGFGKQAEMRWCGGDVARYIINKQPYKKNIR